MGKKHKKKKSNRHSSILIAPPIPKKQNGPGFWVKAGVIISAIALIALWDPLQHWIMSTHDKVVAEKIVSGQINPPKPSPSSKYFNSNEIIFYDSILISNKYPRINGILIPGLTQSEKSFEINVGARVITISMFELYGGIDISRPFISNFIETKIGLVARGDRIYFNAIFNDIETGQTVGEMEWNHWKLYKENFLDYYNDDNTLEVLDKQHNIIFSIVYDPKYPNFICLNGYFMDYKSIAIVLTSSKIAPDTLVVLSKKDSVWKEKAMTQIEKITSFHL